MKGIEGNTIHIVWFEKYCHTGLRVLDPQPQSEEYFILSYETNENSYFKLINKCVKTLIFISFLNKCNINQNSFFNLLLCK